MLLPTLWRKWRIVSRYWKFKSIYRVIKDQAIRWHFDKEMG
jgi:hypothetical protein